MAETNQTSANKEGQPGLLTCFSVQGFLCFPLLFVPARYETKTTRYIFYFDFINFVGKRQAMVLALELRTNHQQGDKLFTLFFS